MKYSADSPGPRQGFSVGLRHCSGIVRTLKGHSLDIASRLAPAVRRLGPVAAPPNMNRPVQAAGEIGPGNLAGQLLQQPHPQTVDSSQIPRSATRSAAAAAIPAFVRSACRYGVRPPARPPAPPGPRLAPDPASAASSAARPCAETAPKPPHRVPCRSPCCRNTTSPASNSMHCAAPFSRFPASGGHSSNSASGCAATASNRSDHCLCLHGSIFHFFSPAPGHAASGSGHPPAGRSTAFALREAFALVSALGAADVR